MTDTDGATGPMTLVQRTLFAGPTEWVNPDLYGKVLRGSAVQRRGSVTIAAESTFTSDTYFGRFPASYWQRWTRVRAVTLSCELQLAGEPVEVLVRASDIGAHVRTLGSTIVTESGTASIEVPLTTFLDGGSMWTEFRTSAAEVKVSAVRWTVADSAQDRKLSIAVCSFNRPVDCATTVETIAADDEVASAIHRLYVTDQGDQPVAEQEGFQRASEALGETLVLIRQANLGGAGGFTRGIVEATEQGTDGVDVLLMDDDVRVEPETVLRLAGMAKFTTEPTILGAQMLYLFNPDYLLASAEGANLQSLKRGLPTDKYTVHNFDLVTGPLPERRADTGYNGWWSCLIPGEVVERIGLPLPVFFQWDDVEYSLRGRDYGIPTVTLPGAAVWHAEFYWKDVDGFGHYFAMRNGLITAAVRGQFDAKGVAKQMSRQIARSIAAMQYGLAHTHLKAVEDFLEGPGLLQDGGTSALGQVNAERKQYSETIPLDPSETPDVIPVARAGFPPAPNRRDLVLAKRTAKQLAGKVAPGPVVVPFEDSQWWNVSLYGEAFVTDASQSAVRHRTRDAEKAKDLLTKLAKVSKRLLSDGPEVAMSYEAAVPELVDRDNWRRLFAGE